MSPFSNNRRYSLELIERIEQLCWVDNKSPQEIAEAVNMTTSRVKAIMKEYEIVSPVQKQYRLPDFSKWNFEQDNGSYVN